MIDVDILIIGGLHRLGFSNCEIVTAMTDELTWDYSGDESSPFLRRAVSPMYRYGNESE